MGDKQTEQMAPCGVHPERYWVEIVTPDPDHAPADNPGHVSVASYCALCVVERLGAEVKRYESMGRQLDELSRDGWTYTITNGRPDRLVGVAILKGWELNSPHAEAAAETLELAILAVLEIARRRIAEAQAQMALPLTAA